jgi:hypothetical protein
MEVLLIVLLSDFIIILAYFVNQLNDLTFLAGCPCFHFSYVHCNEIATESTDIILMYNMGIPNARRASLCGIALRLSLLPKSKFGQNQSKRVTHSARFY